MAYGQEVIIDLHECDSSCFTRHNIELFFEELCDACGMERCDLHFWDDVGVPKEDRQTEPHLKGTSAIQFIMTSSVVIHTLDLLDQAYINVFSCDHIELNHVVAIATDYFKGRVVQQWKVQRV